LKMSRGSGVEFVSLEEVEFLSKFKLFIISCLIFASNVFPSLCNWISARYIPTREYRIFPDNTLSVANLRALKH
jgi:hypothetical protein